MQHRRVTTEMTCGADILLARHGNHIITWRVDSRTDSTLARLDDGTWVSARNHLDLPGATPDRRLARGWANYKSGKLALKPHEVRQMGKLLGWGFLAVGVATAFMFWMILVTVG